MGILPDIRVLPHPTLPFTPAPNRDAAIAGAIALFPGEHLAGQEEAMVD